MADGATFSLDAAKLSADTDRLVRQCLSAGTAAVSAVTKRLERRLEEETRAKIPGRLWRAWASRSYPKSGPARNPAGEVFVNGSARSRGAMRFWTQPGAIRGKSGQYLAIPLPAAGSRGRDRMLTPGEWERATGVRLRFVYRPGRPSLLVADGTANGGTGVFRPITRARTKADERRGFIRGQQSVPIFVLLPLVKHRNSVAVAPLVQQAERELAAEFMAQAGAIR